MAHAAEAVKKESILIRNIGTIVTGELDRPLIEGDAIWVEKGIIREVGFESRMNFGSDKPVKTMDARGTTAAPGLIDNHFHPVVGDWTPRQRTFDFIDSCLHGGVTTMLSAGEVHLPGRPSDPVGAKSLAIVAAKSYSNARPSGVKVHAGAVMLEKGMVENDFMEMAREGVHLVGEVGLSSVHPMDAAPYVRWAQEAGMKVTIHTGGSSIPGSNVIGAEMVLACGADVAAHVNGGPTALPFPEFIRLVEESDVRLEIVHCGNHRYMLMVVEELLKRDQLSRLLIGTDMPSGFGVIPVGILRVLAHLASLANLPPEKAWACATGNAARLHGFNRGIVAAGFEADIVLADAPMGCVAPDALGALANGDIPAIGAVIIDGDVKVVKSRNTPPCTRQPIYM